ncbi:dynein axonemal assembly factor 6-like [Lycorma delicatula]|uniref:dynein axonemal assembly factor 6-like n=1 Tax=Lycorma delicatula TaxID=130591 RepID=UPI003F5146DC
MEIGYDGMKQLVQLLNPIQEDNSSDDDLPSNGVSKLSPGDIKTVKVNVKGISGDNESDNKCDKKYNPKAIWQLHEVPEIQLCDDASYDPRERPEHDIKYRQSVTPEDIYLQLGLKTPASASCEAMLITVCLKKESHDDVDLQISRQHMDIRSPLYRLSLPLPHPVNPDKCTAEWESDTCILKVTLLLNRELDYVNF